MAGGARAHTKMPTVESKLIEIAAAIIGETETAYLVSADGHRKAWLPRSLVRYDDRTKVATLPLWLVQEKQLRHGPTSR
jgi:hypothetical protein